VHTWSAARPKTSSLWLLHAPADVKYFAEPTFLFTQRMLMPANAQSKGRARENQERQPDTHDEKPEWK